MSPLTMPVERRRAHVRVSNRFGMDTRVYLVIPGDADGTYQEIDLTKLLMIESVTIDAEATDFPRATIRLIDVTFDVLAEVEKAEAQVKAMLGLTPDRWKELGERLRLGARPEAAK